MKKFTLILFVLIISCKGKDYKNHELSFNQTYEKGGTTFLELKIDSIGKVTGSKGYVYAERMNGFRDIEGNLNDGEVIGTAYDENKDETNIVNIKISEDFVEYIEQGKEVIKLPINKKETNKSEEQSSGENGNESEESNVGCDNEEVLKQVTEMIRENGVRGAKVIKGFTIRKDEKTSNCDCEARLEGEYWIKDGPAPLDRHSVKEPKVRFSIYKNYEGQTMIEITYSEI